MSGSDDLAALLLAALRRRDPAVRQVGGFQQLTGGAMQETWRLDASGSEGSRTLVLRRTRNGGARPRAGTIGLREQAAITSIAGSNGIPSPQVIAVLDEADGLGPGFVMTLVEGETVPQKILRSPAFGAARKNLAAQCGDILAHIHAIPLDALPPLSRSSAADKITALRSQYDALDRPRPVFELAFQWLTRRLPPDPDQLSLVHGDFRNGNLIVDSQGVAAVLDWERAFVGDPMYDVGWLCVGSWRFGEIDAPVGGFGQVDQFAAAYEAAGGVMNLDRARFWEAYGILDWGVTTMAMAAEAATTNSLEAAAIGRRTSETEIDLLRLIRDEQDRG